MILFCILRAKESTYNTFLHINGMSKVIVGKKFMVKISSEWSEFMCCCCIILSKLLNKGLKVEFTSY